MRGFERLVYCAISFICGLMNQMSIDNFIEELRLLKAPANGEC